MSEYVMRIVIFQDMKNHGNEKLSSAFHLKIASVTQRTDEFPRAMVVMLDFRIFVRKRFVTSGACPRSIETFLLISGQRKHFVVIFQYRCDSMLLTSEVIVEYCHAIATRIGHRLRFEFGIGRNGVRTESGRNVFVQDVRIIVHGKQARIEIRINDKWNTLRFLGRFPFHDAFIRLRLGIFRHLIDVFRTIGQMIRESPRRRKWMNAVRKYMSYPIKLCSAINHCIHIFDPSVIKLVACFQREEYQIDVFLPRAAFGHEL
jgi:hypothetical protein